MRKLGRPSDQRKAMLRGLVTSLLKYGKIETTKMRAKETQRIAEKLITKAIRTYNETVDATKKRDNTKVVNDSPRKLAARRAIMEYLYDFPEKKGEKESKYEYKQRTKDVKHPVMEKLFREIAPKYAERAKSSGQGGGYTRIVKMGPRRGDAAEVVILELV
ncbi:MAG TPA: 50S ribosomal protein L17 [Clostridiales bacterium]|nr:50S ribosomal protein L17 [Clostridiales bacterium]